MSAGDPNLSAKAEYGDRAPSRWKTRHPTLVILPMETLLDHRLTAADFRMLAALASWRSSKDGFAHPSRKNIAKRCGGIEERSVSRRIRRLEDLGWAVLIQGGGRNRTNIYHIRIPWESIENPDTDVSVSGKTVTSDTENPDMKVTPTEIPTENQSTEEADEDWVNLAFIGPVSISHRWATHKLRISQSDSRLDWHVKGDIKSIYTSNLYQWSRTPASIRSYKAGL